jgi:hypothetical protein
LAAAGNNDNGASEVKKILARLMPARAAWPGFFLAGKRGGGQKTQE